MPCDRSARRGYLRHIGEIEPVLLQITNEAREVPGCIRRSAQDVTLALAGPCAYICALHERLHGSLLDDPFEITRRGRRCMLNGAKRAQTREFGICACQK